VGENTERKATRSSHTTLVKNRGLERRYKAPETAIFMDDIPLIAMISIYTYTLNLLIP